VNDEDEVEDEEEVPPVVATQEELNKKYGWNR
jgi:hypothetical protein